MNKKWLYDVGVNDDFGTTVETEKDAFFVCGRLLEIFKGTGYKISITKYHRNMTGYETGNDYDNQEIYSVIADSEQEQFSRNFVENFEKSLKWQKKDNS